MEFLKTIIGKLSGLADSFRRSWFGKAVSLVELAGCIAIAIAAPTVGIQLAVSALSCTYFRSRYGSNLAIVTIADVLYTVMVVLSIVMVLGQVNAILLAAIITNTILCVVIPAMARLALASTDAECEAVDSAAQ